MANAKKQSLLSSLEQILKDSPNFAVFFYEKVPHTTLESLRNELRKNDSKFKMMKNTLFQKALRQLALTDKNISQVDASFKNLTGNSALLSFGHDWSAALSAFHTFSEKEKGLSFKVGYLDQQVFLREDLEKIAKLPAKPQLMAQLIGSMKSPISHLTYAMKFNIQKFAYILNAKAQQTAS